MKTAWDRVILLAPRVLAILFLLFLMLFSLDVIEPNRDLAGIVIGLIVHNIPVFVLAALLAVAWRWEWVGGAGFILIGVLYAVATWSKNNWPAIMFLSGSATLIGVLFLLAWWKKRQIAVLSKHTGGVS